MNKIEQIALIGPTASGKTALSIDLAKQYNAHILSLDSLSIYREIDIVSAKPTLKERAGIEHFGLDYLYPNESFDVAVFMKLYREIYARCEVETKNLIIVGGTGFYLKMLLEGISELPSISDEARQKSQTQLKDLSLAYEMLRKIDSRYISSIASSDRYRIEKALDIYFETGMSPSEYFIQNPPCPVIKGTLPIYQIDLPREMLRERVTLRTKQMLQEGMIDEVCTLERKYTRRPNCMKAIGIKETLDYLDGVYCKTTLAQKITTNTMRLAKRQTTFNQSQFDHTVKGSVEQLREVLLSR